MQGLFAGLRSYLEHEVLSGCWVDVVELPQELHGHNGGGLGPDGPDRPTHTALWWSEASSKHTRQVISEMIYMKKPNLITHNPLTRKRQRGFTETVK